MFNNDVSTLMGYLQVQEKGSIALESMLIMRADQNPNERLKYFDIVNEATMTNEGKASLIMKLYKSILSHKNFDTEFIARSNGEFTKFAHFQTMMDAIDTIHDMGIQTSEVVQIDALVAILNEYRQDFVYGYKGNIDFIIMYYEMIIMGLYQLIDFAIVGYVKNVDSNVSVSIASADGARIMYSSIITKIINVFNKGDWKKLVAAVKKHKTSTVMESLTAENDIATEDVITANLSIPVAASMVDNAGKAFGGIVAAWNAGTAGASGLAAVAGGLKGVLVSILGAGPAIAMGVLGVTVLSIGALFALRLLVYWFYSARFRLSDYLNRQADILRYNISAADSNREKKEQKLAKLEALATFVAVKSKDTAKNAQREISKDNKESYSTSEIKMDAMNAASSVDF